MGPQGRIGRCNRGMTDPAGAGVPGSSVLFEKFPQAGPPGPGMADGAAPQGERRSLVLDGLIVVRVLPRRDHGVRAAMTGGTTQAAVASGIAVEFAGGINFGDVRVAGHAFGFGQPRDPASRNTVGNLLHATVAGGAVPVRGGVGQASVAPGRVPRVAIIAADGSTLGSRSVGVEAMDGLGQGDTSRPGTAFAQDGAAMAGGAENRY